MLADKNWNNLQPFAVYLMSRRSADYFVVFFIIFFFAGGLHGHKVLRK